MIHLENLPNNKPYNLFSKYFDEAVELNQEPINAICISSFDKNRNEVDSRYVNLKYIISSEWTFFSNYESPKAISFEKHNQISALIYWPKMDLQIRMKAIIRKSSSDFSDIHFKNRNKEKNAIAISSAQSKKIESYDKVIENYNHALKSKALNKRPNYWGGYSFSPYYFEFWKGHKNRLNNRDVFELVNERWKQYKIQP